MMEHHPCLGAFFGLIVAALCLTMYVLGGRAESGTPMDRAFGEYWYQGEAELTSYALEQARYGEVHQGHAVLVVVTEDFSRSKQVKLDHPAEAGAESWGGDLCIGMGPRCAAAHHKSHPQEAYDARLLDEKPRC